MANKRKFICSLYLAIIRTNFHPPENGGSPSLLNVRKLHILNGLNNTTDYHSFNTIVKTLKFKTGSSLKYVIQFECRIKTFIPYTCTVMDRTQKCCTFYVVMQLCFVTRTYKNNYNFQSKTTCNIMYALQQHVSTYKSHYQAVFNPYPANVEKMVS